MTILLREHAHFARQFHALSFRAILREVYLLIFSGDSESVSLSRSPTKPFLIHLQKRCVDLGTYIADVRHFNCHSMLILQYFPAELR